MKKLLLPFLSILFLATCRAESMTDIQPDLKIGDTYQGGIIAYILLDGDPGYVAGETHGIIAAPSDQGKRVAWGCFGASIGDTSTAIGSAAYNKIGTGAANTKAIVTGCAQAGIAAKLCNDLVIGEYDDWYLPSRDELNKLYLNRVAIGGFAKGYYWSSTEVFLSNAFRQYFPDGFQDFGNKLNTYRVRAVRAF